MMVYVEVKELFLTDRDADNGDGTYSPVPIGFDQYGALLPFFLPCKIFCRLAFDQDDSRDLNIDLRVLDPNGEPCGFMKDENHNSTISLLRYSLTVEPGTPEWAGVLDTHGLTFHTYGVHSILLIVNGNPISTMPFAVMNPRAPIPD